MAHRRTLTPKGPHNTRGPTVSYGRAPGSNVSGAIRVEEGTLVSLKGKLYLLIAIIVIGVLIGMNNPQPGP